MISAKHVIESPERRKGTCIYPTLFLFISQLSGERRLNVTTTSKRGSTPDQRCETYLCISTPGSCIVDPTITSTSSFPCAVSWRPGSRCRSKGRTRPEMILPAGIRWRLWRCPWSVVLMFLTGARWVRADVRALSRAASMVVKARRSSADGSNVWSCSAAVRPEILFALVSISRRVWLFSLRRLIVGMSLDKAARCNRVCDS